MLNILKTARKTAKRPVKRLTVVFNITPAALFISIVCLFCNITLAKTPARSSPNTAKHRSGHKYISVDEIKPGMKGYCLTVLHGTKIEKFNLDVIDIIKDHPLGRDAIIVIVTDERFKETGPVRGCSGSPVYIQGRLAGALAWGWSFSKDPLYRVTPIESMLEVGKNNDTSRQLHSTTSTGTQTIPTLGLDFTKPLDLAAINEHLNNLFLNSKSSQDTKTLIITSLPESVCNELAPQFEPMGLIPVAGGRATGISLKNQLQNYENGDFKPGGVFAVPLVAGDISMSAVGTVTEVYGNKVYALGHPFLGYGPVDLPMATGRVHTIVSNVLFSFKLATADQIIGTIRYDEAAGLYGQIGQKPNMIPAHIEVERHDLGTYRDKDTYDCQLAVNRLYTPRLLQAVLVGTGAIRGPLPPEHMIKYKANISIEAGTNDSISFENFSSGQTFREFVGETVGVVTLLMNNPYKKVNITSLDFHMQILPENILARVWSVKLSDSNVKPGQTIDVSVDLQSYMSEKSTHQLKLKIPENLTPAQYQITVAGAHEYENFLRKTSPHRFTTENMPSLVNAMKNLLAIRRNSLYLTMTLRKDGITLQQAQLPHLPTTKSLLLQDTKRTTKTLPYQHWIEKNIPTNNIILGKKTLKITVEK